MIRSARLAYIVKRFPRLSETFVLNEFLELRRQGIDLRLYALRDPGDQVLHPEAEALLPEVGYVNLATHPWKSRRRLLGGAILQAAAHPGGLARVLWALLSVHRSMPSLTHATEGLWLAGELHKNGVAHLHAHFAHSPAAVAYFSSLAGGPAFSFTAHAKDLYTTLPRNLRIRAAAARFVVTCTESNGQYLRHVLGPGIHTPVQVVRHGTDLRRFHPAGRHPEPGLIVSVGRLVPKKGYADLLDAVRRVAADGTPVRLEVYGGGALRDDLEATVVRLGLAGRVRFHGARPLDEIIVAYARATLFVLAPRILEDGDRDGIPNVLVEAMASGIPVVSTAISGIPELIETGTDGLLVQPGDPEALAAAIQRLLGDAALAERLSIAGRAKVEKRFDLVANTRDLSTLLTAQLAGQPSEAAHGKAIRT